MITYREARKQAAVLLKEAKIENETAESGFLMEYALDVNRNFYLMHQMDEMPEAQQEAYFSLVKRRCQRIPLQYLTGEQEFMGLPFLVNEHVLIPRQDTELLVEHALDLLKQMQQENISPEVLDLCTGSGCIAVSLKHDLPEISVTASDISGDSLDVAQENGRRNGVEIQWILSDLFEQIDGPFDMIVSNPPYIPSAVIPTLMPEVKDHEPLRALDGDDDGLLFYRRIVTQSADYLKQNGYLLFEIGFDQGSAVAEMMNKNGFTDINIIPDLAGLDRVVIGRRTEHV